MKIRKLLAVGCAISLLALTSCKSGQEKKGDEFLGKGMYKNAMKAYLQVDKSGKGSDEFNDNYALAMTRLMMQVAQKDGVQSDVIFDYTQEIPKRLEGSTNAAVVQEVVQSFCDVAKMMWELDSYRGRLEAFRLLDNSAKLAKAANAGVDIAKKTREEISAAWVKKAVADYGSPSADDAVAAEYYLLEVQNLVPDNPELEAALLKVRRINRHNLLIWSPGVNDVNPDPAINNKYSGHFVMGFGVGAFNPGPTSFKGALNIWNSSGGNVLLKPEQITLVSKDGKVVTNTAPISKECLVTENKELKSKTPGLEPEADCVTQVSFTFDSSFKPDYLKLTIKDQSGIKYLAL